MWNPHCHLKKNAGPLEKLIDGYDLIIHNNLNYTTRPSSQRQRSIIDLTLTSLEISQLPI